MKKAFALALALVMALSLAACGTSAPAAGDGTGENLATGLYPGTMEADTVTVNISRDRKSVV